MSDSKGCAQFVRECRDSRCSRHISHSRYVRRLEPVLERGCGYATDPVNASNRRAASRRSFGEVML